MELDRYLDMMDLATYIAKLKCNLMLRRGRNHLQWDLYGAGQTLGDHRGFCEISEDFVSIHEMIIFIGLK